MIEIALSFVGTLGALVVWGLIRHYFPGYLTEKAKNLATKEDIADITRRIEEVKHGYAALLENQKQKGQLKLAALDKRLEVAQQAYVKWWHLLHALHTAQIGDEVQRCQEFWVNNRLYLSEDAAFAFRRAYMAASDHQGIKDSARHNPSERGAVEENFKRITEAEQVLLASAAIPHWSEDVTVAAELQKQA